VGTDEGYLLANRQNHAATRLAALAELFDPSTFRHLRATGIGSGRRCWEVGPGSMSVPQWLADRVGPTGLVGPRLLRQHGLVDVVADAYFPITAPACSALERATIEQIRDRLIDAGAATAAEIDQHLDNIAAGRVPDLATSPLVTVRGRKP
jgi:hypothetical protein